MLSWDDYSKEEAATAAVTTATHEAPAPAQAVVPDDAPVSTPATPEVAVSDNVARAADALDQMKAVTAFCRSGPSIAMHRMHCTWGYPDTSAL